ncbi:MAG: insulinase family protein [Lachnospiraceae bacterium]|nr:insulinase family protein [Lachnospiraceae bacterium]
MNKNIDYGNAYELLQQRELKDIHSEGLYFLHKKSGARVVIVSNDDPNKVFYIGFRTPPKDSTGVPHIIEHTVLCGSEKFPVKDPFIELVKGSMNTFLNAMTFPDKTVYPVASCNDRDFQNLMDVYMDAVLHPNIYNEQNIFRQEGWHLELDSPEGDLSINGVVYNEMKGAYSVADSILEREIMRSLYPDTPYANDSGGDPDVIPTLTYEQYLAFHRMCYHPSNSYIFLYGDMDAKEKLDWLDREYLSAYDRTRPDTVIPVQDPFEEPVVSEKFYPISSEESEEDNTLLSYSWSVGTSLDPVQSVAFDILAYALLNSSGAPIKQALLDAGIGDDIFGGYEGGLLQPMFSVVAKNAEPDELKEFGRIIEHVLTEQAEKGINKATLLSAINGAEFRFREADFGRIPKGLMFGITILDSWLYSDMDPFLHLDELDVYARLRKELDNGYFEELIWKYLLGNKHVSLLCLRPKKGLNAEKEQEFAAGLQKYRDSLSEDDIQRLIRETKDLETYQEEPSSPEDLEKIPLLSRDDMKKVPDPHSNVEECEAGVPLLWHDYETNGIIYLDYLFDIQHIPEDEVPYLTILQKLMGRMDTEEYSYVDLDNEINLHTGGIEAEVNLFELIEGDPEYRAKFEIRTRTLEANLEKAMELAKSMMLHTVFDDEKRLYEILAQSRSQMLTALRESGNSVAATRVMSCTSRKAKYNDLLHGIGQYRVMDEIVEGFEEKKEELKKRLADLVGSIFQPASLLVSVTCRKPGFELVKKNAARITDGLFADMTDRKEELVSLPEHGSEGFMDASQIQFVAMGGNFKSGGFSYHGALRVFRCIMNYEYLWMNLRVRGGAYGCSCTISRMGDICFSSFRDPNLKETLEVYQNVPEYVREFEAGERDMTRYVIGTFSEMDAPLTPAAQGRRSLVAKLCGITQEMLQRDRDEVLNAGVQDIRDLAPLLDAVLDGAYCCAIGNEEKIRQEAELFDHTEAL